MSRYQDVAAGLAERVIRGDLAPGAFLLSVRDFAFREETTATTVARAYRELADAGVIAIEPRRAAHVTLDAVRAARAFLRRGSVRLAEMHDVPPEVATAVAARVTTGDLHGQAVRNLGGFV